MQFNKVRIKGELEELEVRAGSAEIERKFAMLIRAGDLVIDRRREFDPHEEVRILVRFQEPEENVPTDRLKVIRVERVEYVG